MKGLKEYRKELENRQEELRAAIRDRGEIAIEQAPDELDATQLSALRDQALSELDRESRLLREVAAALARIDNGSYGICEQCEEEISPKRLKALPWARNCVTCQDAIDRGEMERAA